MTNELGSTRTDEIVDYLNRPRLWIPETSYPDYFRWIERVHGQLKKDTKRAMVALHRNNVVGAVVYQQHKELADTLEIKNVSVSPDATGRYVASFLLRNAEVEGARDFAVRTAVCDAKASDTSMRMFLLRHRYKVLQEIDLYQLGSGRDLIFQKTIVH